MSESLPPQPTAAPRRSLLRLAAAGCALAVLAGGAAVALRLAVSGPAGRSLPFAMLFGAIAAAAYRGGLVPGLAATATSGALSYLFFMGLAGADAAVETVRLGVFLGVGAVVSAIAEAIHRARRRVVTLLQHMPDACSGFDRSWRYTYVNARWEELFGLPASRAVGRVLWEVFPDLVGSEMERHYRRVMAERLPLAFEVYAPYARSWVEVRVYPTEDGMAAHIRDITDRRRAGEALRASERRYRALVGATTQAVWSGAASQGGQAGGWWAELTGQTAEQSAGWGWLDALHPDDRGRARAAWSDAVERREAYEVEYRVRDRGGRFRRVAARGVPVFDDQGRFEEWVGTLADVQGREDAAAAVRLAEERLRLAIEAGEMGTYDWDARTDTVVWSENHFRLFGYDPRPGGEATFEMWRSRVHPDDLERVLAAVEAARRDGSLYRTEYRVVRPGDAEPAWVAAGGQFFLDAAGGPARMVGVVFDVTERRRFTESLERRVAERTADLARSESRFRTLFEHAPVAVWEEDFTDLALWFTNLRLAGVTDLRRWLADRPGEARRAMERIRVLDVNREAAAQNGATDKAHLMANLPALFTERGLEAFAEELALLYEGHRAIELGTSARRLDGKEAEIVIRLQVPGEAGAPDWGRVIVTGTDVTERARAEAELRRAREAAEAASKAKGEFLANMSHEIRTPMNGVLGMTELLLDTDLTADQRQYLSVAKRSAESLLAILDDIMDFSKIEAGKLALDPVEFRPCEGLSDVLQALAARADQKGLTLGCEVADDVPETVVGDLGRLRQVLFNLVGNAIKFTERGEVSVAVRRDGDPNLLQFEVSDTGIGIPADKLGAIFQPFEQAETSMARRFGGTGLGLSISTRLVELMGGRLWVESEVGRGSTFRFTARLGAAPGSATPSEPPAPSSGRRLRVLLAEDDATNQHVALAMLEMLGHHAAVAANGHEVLAALEREAFDLVLMDVQMPRMDGLEATARIREAERGTGRRLPIVALTAHAMKGDRERFLDAGMDGYVTKPVRFEELRRALGATAS